MLEETKALRVQNCGSMGCSLKAQLLWARRGGRLNMQRVLPGVGAVREPPEIRALLEAPLHMNPRILGFQSILLVVPD